MRLYECGVRFDKMMQNGLIKKITEQYLVDAITFTEAEARITNETKPFISGDFDVVTIKRTRYSEIINPEADCDKWFEVKINLITIDEKTRTEKKSPVHCIVNADTNKDAHQLAVDFMKGTISDYEIATVKETKILEVYRYETATSDS